MSSLREIRNARCFYSEINKSKILKYVVVVPGSTVRLVVPGP
jgi:hypothetical protein